MRALRVSQERALADLRDVVGVAGGSVEATFAPIGGVDSLASALVPTVLVALGAKSKRVQRPTFGGCADVLVEWVSEEYAKRERRV